MTARTIEDLRERFERGDSPTAQDFLDLLDTFCTVKGENWPQVLPAVSGEKLTKLPLTYPIPVDKGGTGKTTAADALAALGAADEASIRGILIYNVVQDGPITLSETQARYAEIRITDTGARLLGDTTLLLPASASSRVLIRNFTAVNLTATTGSGATVDVYSGRSAAVATLGLDVIATDNGRVLRAVVGGYVKTLTAADSPATLTVADAGLILIDATAGNVDVTLPAANALAGVEFTIARLDTSANIATITRAGTDTIEGANSAAINTRLRLKGDGVSAWKRTASDIATQAQADAGTDDDTIITPQKLRWGFSASLGANTGYIALPSWLGGWIAQWGINAVPTGSAGLDVTFPLAFPSACRAAFAIQKSSGTTTIAGLSAEGTTTTLRLTQDSGATKTCYWFAVGS